jgi:hypothetical protein
VESKGSDPHPVPASSVPDPKNASSTGAPQAPLPPAAFSDKAFVASTALETWIYERPDLGAKKQGYLRAGSVMRTSEHPVATSPGCPQGFYPIEPLGYVCVGPTATRDVSNEIVRALPRRPNTLARFPYMYGLVKSVSPIYARLPNRAALEENEPDLERHVARWLTDSESGAGYGQEIWQDGRPGDLISAKLALDNHTTDEARIPWFLQNGRQVPNLSGLVTSRDLVAIARSKRRNGFAFVDSFLFEGRRYNVTTDLLVVPADRLRPIRGSDFHGFAIPAEVDFPFALVRSDHAHQYRYDGKRNQLIDAGSLPWRSAVPLTGKRAFYAGRLHFETKDHTWISDHDASRLDPPKKLPGWATAGEKWIDINISKQTLVAYEGTKAVFATLVSTGEAGLGDPTQSKSTTRGIYRINTKHISATMDSEVVGEEFELRDIPYVQYFQDGYALHAAYWHDGFGQPRSHGCVNLSPEDARRLFFWTDPPVPPGWHGVMKGLTGTIVFTHG